MKERSYEAALAAIKIEQDAVAAAAECVKIPAFAEAVALIAAAPKIMTCASGSSGIAAKKFAHSLCCIEKAALFMPPCEAVHGGLGALKKEDCLVMVSRGGKTAELMPIIDVCVKKGAALIAVTENMDSKLAKAATVTLPMKIGREADKLNAMATASFAATIALFDALLCALIEETNYTSAQFALIHPGGAVGERLNRQ